MSLLSKQFLLREQFFTAAQRRYRIFFLDLQTLPRQLTAKYIEKGEYSEMKATGIVRRIDDLGRIVIPKEIRRTLRIRMGDPSLKTLTQAIAFCSGMQELAGRGYIG